jgi:RHS repeat-associated protein
MRVGVHRVMSRLPRWVLGAMFAGAGAVGALLWYATEVEAAPTCSIYWTGQTSQDWGTTSNWSLSNGGTSTNRLPGRSDYVCMSTKPQQATIDLNQSATVAGVDWPATTTVSPTLDVGADGSLTIGTSSIADASSVASLQVTGGTVSTNTSITTASLALSSNGEIEGTGTFTVPSSGSLTLSGGELASGIQLINDGIGKEAQSASVAFVDNSELENAGTLTLADNGVLSPTAYGTGWVINEVGGKISYSGSASSSSTQIAAEFDNFGTVTVPQGTLELTGGSTPASTGDIGSYDAGFSGIIDFSGDQNFANGVTFPGSGEIAITSGQISIPSGDSVSTPNLLLSGGTFAGRGTLMIPANGTADLANGALVGGLHYVNDGTTTEAAIANIDMNGAAVIDNAATMTLADSATFQACCGATPGWIVNESGATLTYTGSASSSSTVVNIPFDNFGTVTVIRGTLSLDGGSSSESTSGDTGTYSVATAGVLSFGGDQELAKTATFTGAGQVTVAGGGQLFLKVAGSTITFANLLVYGTLSGKGTISIPSGDIATLSGASLSGGITLRNSGSLTLATDSAVEFENNSELENAGSLALSDGDSIGAEYLAAEGALVNEPGATMSYTGSASNSGTNVYVPFDNFGTVTVSRGTLTISGGSSTFSAGDSGMYNVASTAFLVFGGGYRSFVSSSTFPGAGEVTDDGDLAFLGDVTLPNFTLTGTVEADPGAVITATLSATPSGAIQVDGDRPGHFGEFVATGSLNATSLYLTLSNPTFAPPCDSSIVAARASALSGSFARVIDSNLPSGGSAVESNTTTTANVLISCPVPAVSEQQTYGTGGGIDEANPSGYEAEPVNTGTGAYSTQQTDAQLAGLGVPFTFTRYYSSDNTGAGPLGPGWTDTFSTSLNPQGSTVYLTSENGQQATFLQQSDGTYLGAAGVYSQLTQTSSGWLLIRNNRTELTFNSAGQLLTITDLNGIGLTLTYNSSGQVASVKDYAGRTVTFTYNSSGLLTSMALPLARTVTYNYNSAGQLDAVSDAAGDVTKYYHNNNGQLTSIVDGNSHTLVTNTYNSSGQVIAQVNADAEKSTFSYNSSTGVTTFTDARGNKWEDTYNGYALISRTDPLGGTTSYAYDANLDVSAITSPNGNTTVMDYDAYGDMIDRTSPSPFNYEETWTYNKFDEPLSYTDGRGFTTTYSYDSEGNLLNVTYPDGSSVSHTYSATNGALLSTTTASDKTTTYAYDSAGDLTKLTSPLGEITTMGYDAAGRLTSKTSPRGNVSGATASEFTTTYTYDADDRLLTTTDPLGHTTTTTYDKVGNIITTTDPRGNTTTNTYDAANHLTKVTAANGTTTTSTYDAVGNLATRIDGNDNTTIYSYDAANHLISTKTALGDTTTDAYDKDGNLIETIDAIGVAKGSGGITTYTYDQLDRRTSVTYSDGTPAVHYSYDADSNVVEMTDGTGTTTYTFNARNELTKLTQPGGSFTYTYTPDGQVSGRTYPDGLAIAATYDADQRLATVTSGGATTTYGYDLDGDLITTTLPASAGVVESRTYNDADQLTGVKAATSSSTLDAYTVTRDADGDPTALTTPSGPITYTYDSLGRITEACYGASCVTNKVTYTYDKDGNIATETNGATTPVTTTNTYNADDELMKSVTGTTTVTPTYDADGRETSSGATTYTWNLANELTSTTSGAVTTTYTYNGNGDLATSKAGSVTTTEIWDPNNTLPQLATITSGAAVRNYLWGVGSLGFTTSTASFYDLHDDQGSTVGVISSTGVEQSTASYGPFGNTITSTNLVSTAPTQQIGWQGQVSDSGGLLYDLRARQYSPVTGTFLSPDPLPQALAALAVSPYAYADDQPTVFWDPRGLYSFSVCFGICAGYTSGEGFGVGIGTPQIDAQVSNFSVGISPDASASALVYEDGSVAFNGGVGAVGGSVNFGSDGSVVVTGALCTPTLVSVCVEASQTVVGPYGGVESHGYGTTYSDYPEK